MYAIRSRWLKWIQRRLLSFLSTPEGCVVIVLGLITTVNTILYVAIGPCAFTAMLDILGVNRWPSFSTRSLCNQVGWKDNIGGVDVSHRTSFGAIDVVYTWVNGSDPRWMRKKDYWKAIETHNDPPVGSSPDGSVKRMVKLGQRRRRLQEGEDDHSSAFGYGNEYRYNYGHQYGNGYGSGYNYGSNYGSGYGLDDYPAGYGERRFDDDYHQLDYSNDDGIFTAFNETSLENATLVNSTHLMNDTMVMMNDTAQPTDPIEEEVEEEKDDSAADNRYRDSNELLFSLRSLEKYAPWVRHIYVVTDNQVPNWLNLDNPRLTIVPHQELFPNKSHLPVFSSPAIETHLHRIPGLSQRFAYFNDDVFLGAPTWPEDFIGLDGSQKIYLSWDVPKCNDGCPDSWIGDGHCDKACNVSRCGFDFPDCVNKTEGSDMGTRNKNRNKKSKSSDKIVKKGKPSTCAKSCPDNWLGDKVCDSRCNVAECAYDAGDCGLDKVAKESQGVRLTLTGIPSTVNHTGNMTVFNDRGAVWASTVGELPVLTPTANASEVPYTLLRVPYDTFTGYVNYSDVFPLNQSINEVGWELRQATLEDPHSLIQNSVVIQKHSTLVLVFHHQGLHNPKPFVHNLLPATAVVTLFAVKEVNGTMVDSKAMRFRVMVTKNVTSSETTHEEDVINSEVKHRPPRFQVEGYAAICPPVDETLNISCASHAIDLSLHEKDDSSVEIYFLSKKPSAQGLTFKHPEGNILIRQYVEMPNYPSSVLTSIPQLFSHNHLRGWGIRNDSSQERLNHNLSLLEPNAFRVQLAPHMLPNNESSSKSPWIAVKVDVVVNGGKNMPPRDCASKGSWEHDTCVLSRLACVEAMIRISPRSRRRLLIEPTHSSSLHSLPIRASVVPIRISLKDVATDSLNEKVAGELERHLRGSKLGLKKSSLQQTPVIAPPVVDDEWLESRIEWWLSLIQSTVASNMKTQSLADRRRLLDTFGDSLIYVNQLYNKRFGPETGMRKVPAHMPHFIDREVLAGLQEAYAEEFDATSQHRFRSSTDMQYSFAYFYWLQNTKKAEDIAWNALWHDELDVDHNGYLDENELLTLTAMAKGKEPTDADVEEMRDCLTTAVRNQNNTKRPKQARTIARRVHIQFLKLFGRVPEDSVSSAPWPDDGSSEYLYATLDAVLACPISLEGLRRNSRKAPTFEKITQLTEVAFEMIGDDFNKTKDQLNSIRARKTKFVCVNDDMKHPTTEMVAFLQDFYLSFFPFPSQFELPPNVRNEFLYYDQWKRNRQTNKMVWILVAVIVIMLLLYIFTQKFPLDDSTLSETSEKKTESSRNGSLVSNNEGQKTDRSPTKKKNGKQQQKNR